MRFDAEGKGVKENGGLPLRTPRVVLDERTSDSWHGMAGRITGICCETMTAGSRHHVYSPVLSKRLNVTGSLCNVTFVTISTSYSSFKLVLLSLNIVSSLHPILPQYNTEL